MPLLSHNGQVKTLSEWARVIGMDASALYRRLKRGWPMDRAISTPPKTSEKHGRNGSSEYIAWLEMRARCNQPRNHAWPHYGGRGIRVCERWQESFSAFYADMGAKPTQRHSLDRIDNNGNYEPGNCRWATKAEQTRNRRVTVFLTLGGRTQTITEWGRELGLLRTTIDRRLRAGDSPERALRPRDPQGRKRTAI